MFIPMASTFIIAILGSLVLSFTFVPSMCMLILGRNSEDKEPWVMRVLHRTYLPILEKALGHSKVIISGIIIFLIGGAILFSRMGGEFLPRLDEGSIAVQFIRPVTTGISHSVELDKKSMEVLLRTPEISHVFSRIGTADIALDPMGPNISDSYVMLDMSKSNRSKSQIIDEIVKNLEDEVPGQRLLVSQPIQLRFNELMEGTRADVSVKVFGDNMELATETAERIEALLKTIEGSGDVEVEAKGKQSVLEIVPLKDKIKLYGISNSEILEAVGIGLGGQEVGKFFEGQKKFDIVVRLNDRYREDLNEIALIPVTVAGNKTVPLREVARIRFKDNYSSFSREQAKRRIAVLINPRGKNTEDFVHEAQEKIEKELQLPDGIFLEWGGQF